MGNKDLKTRTPISNAIDTKLLTLLRKYSTESKIPLSRLLDGAIEDYLRKQKIEIQE